MYIKVLLNLGFGMPDFKQDDEVEVSEDLGRRLIAQDLAVEIEAPRKRAAKPAKDKSSPQPKEPDE